MINLEKISGLPIELTDDNHLKFNAPMKDQAPTITRQFYELQPVLMDHSVHSKATEVYYVYRNLCLPGDEHVVNNNNISFDVTVIPAVMFGQEYNKTVGHYHANIPGLPVAHPEIYEVLHGEALFLLQKMDPEFKTLITVLSIEAQPGDKVVYPPNYGHIIVNTGTDTLVTANWISKEYKPLYEPIKDRHGMAYYVIRGQNNDPVFVKNTNYQGHQAVRSLTIADKIKTEFGFDANEPMYSSVVKNPKLVEFLSNPSKYAVQLSTISS